MKNIIIENAQLMFKNFSGASKQFNERGKREFNIVLDPDTAERMAADGWYIRPLKPKDEYTEPRFLLKVTVNMNSDHPPKIVLITSRGKTVLSEADLHILDFAILTNVDVCITPYHYNYLGRTGVSAYLQSMYATMYEDELEQKYMDVPDSGVNCIMPNEP